jgi:DNA-binding response OmpR family regulator
MAERPEATTEGQRQVLLVDDEPDVLAGLRRALHKEPYAILCASSVAEALDILRSKAVQVVVSDQDMPGVQGTTFLAQVRQWFPDTVRFMLTGRGTLDVATQAITAGAVSDFFLKPCDHADLALAIRSALQQQDLLLEARSLLRADPQQAAEFEHWAQTYPRVMKVHVPQDEFGRSLATAAERLFKAALHRLRSAAAKNVLLVACGGNLLARSTVQALHDTGLIVDWPRSNLFYRKGREILVLFPVLPQQRYIVRTAVADIYIDRLTLVYLPPSSVA